jgi:hypothetical protein
LFKRSALTEPVENASFKLIPKTLVSLIQVRTFPFMGNPGAENPTLGANFEA